MPCKVSRNPSSSNAAGQAVVEMALVLPLLILLTLGVIEFGLVFHNCYKLTCATRESARIASMGMPGDDVARRFRQTTGFSADRCSLDISFPQGRTPGMPVVVKASLRYRTLTPIMGFKPLILRDTLAMSLESN